MTSKVESPQGELTSLSTLQSDRHNANKGTQRGLEMIRASLEKLGAGRSIVLDKHGRIVAGNQTVKAAGLAGMDDVIVIRTDGRQIVAVQRTDLDLDSAEGRELALIDNRSSEIGLSWDLDVLTELQTEGLDLSGLFDSGEIDALLGEINAGWPAPGSSEPCYAQPGVNLRSAVGGTAALSPESEEGPQAAPSPPPALGGATAQGVAPPQKQGVASLQRPLGPQGPPSTPALSSVQPGQAYGLDGSAGVAFKEFDESVAAGLTVHQCPACGNRWAA